MEDFSTFRQGAPSGVMGNKGVQWLRSQKLHLYEQACCPAVFGWPPAARSLLGAPWELLSHYGQITETGEIGWPQGCETAESKAFCNCFTCLKEVPF